MPFILQPLPIGPLTGQWGWEAILGVTSLAVTTDHDISRSSTIGGNNHPTAGPSNDVAELWCEVAFKMGSAADPEGYVRFFNEAGNEILSVVLDASDSPNTYLLAASGNQEVAVLANAWRDGVLHDVFIRSHPDGTGTVFVDTIPIGTFPGPFSATGAIVRCEMGVSGGNSGSKVKWQWVYAGEPQ